MSARRLLLMIGLVAAGLVAPAVAWGQGSIRLEVDPSVVVFPTPGAAQFDVGWVQHGGVVVAVTSRPPNVQWELRIRADGDMGQGKPVGDLLWRVAGSGAWTPLVATATPITQGAGDQNVALEFRILLDWASDGPGAYLAAIDFTLERL